MSWTLGKREKYNTRIDVKVKKHDGRIQVHFRHFDYNKEEGYWYATRKGVALSLDEWDKFVGDFQAIGLEVNRLRSQKEKIEAVHPKKVKKASGLRCPNEEEVEAVPPKKAKHCDSDCI